MGAVNAKENNSSSSANVKMPSSLEKKARLRQNMEYISPLHRSSAFDESDPRSPGGLRRTPVHSPFSSPSLSGQAYRERVIMRLGSASKFASIDPRSPASRRTPVAGAAAPLGRVTPPPFSLGDSRALAFDPRSPYMMRTPLALSTQSVAVLDDVVVAEVEDLHASLSTPQKADDDVVVVESSVAESTAEKVTRETFTSSSEYSISPSLMALSISSLSPALGYKKRKQSGAFLERYPSLSPLKKSYSAPMGDENTPPQLKLSSNTVTPTNKPRAPLSPLSQRVLNTRYCADLQPIKFRMDPGVLIQ